MQRPVAALAELQRLVDEQTALRRVATLVARGADQDELVDAVTSEVAQLFDAQVSNMMRWDGESICVIGDWSGRGAATLRGRVYEYGGDTITARVIESGAPARVDSAADLKTEFARARWAELGIEASIGAPIVVDGALWGVITASRAPEREPFPVGAEQRLADFAALVGQSLVNAEARRKLAEVADEQAALRRVATLVAGGRPQREVLPAVTSETGRLFSAQLVLLVRWEGVHDEVTIVGCWSDGSERVLDELSAYHPAAESATIQVLETGSSSRRGEASPELGEKAAISAPVIVDGRLLGALTALRPAGESFPVGSDERLRAFSDLAAQSIANARAREDMRASRARLVRAADEARARIERNLHDGAQQHLVAVSMTLRAAIAKLPDSPEKARSLLLHASQELTEAVDELRELARGIHPALLTEHGLAPALEALVNRSPLPITVANDLEERLPPPVEAAAYYVVAESLTNTVRYGNASAVEVRLSRRNGIARVEVVDDGIGGADLARGSGLRGLADRVEALDGRLHVVSPPDAGTRVWAEIPVP